MSGTGSIPSTIRYHPYMGKYVNWHEGTPGEGKLDCNFWVLTITWKRRSHIQTGGFHAALFRRLDGPHPFYEEGYKAGGSPDWHEHQSAVAYGNKFENAIRPRSVGHGMGLKMGFHQLCMRAATNGLGNNITTNDLADIGCMRIHQLSETLYTCQDGVEAAMITARHRKNIA